jgi:hypothetical protein
MHKLQAALDIHIIDEAFIYEEFQNITYKSNKTATSIIKEFLGDFISLPNNFHELFKHIINGVIDEKGILLFDEFETKLNIRLDIEESFLFPIYLESLEQLN